MPAATLKSRQVDPVIIVLKPNVTEQQIEHVVQRVEALGLEAHLSRGTFRTIIGVIGDEAKTQVAPLEAIPGVAQVVPILPPYKLASLEAHPEPSVVEVSGVKFGGGYLGMIAGPCAVESAERLDSIAAAVKAAGANVLRGGAFKPRTSPYAFQGLGEEGLKILRDTGDKYGMPIVTEVMDPRRVELVDRYTDMFQIGARNMQNFNLLTEVGQTRAPRAVEARHERQRQRPADERRVHPAAGQSPTSCCASAASRALTTPRAIYLTWRPCPLAKTLVASADHRRSQPCHRSARFDSGLRWPASRPVPTAYTSKFTIVPKRPSLTASRRYCPSNTPDLAEQMRKLAELLGKTISQPAGASV